MTFLCLDPMINAGQFSAFTTFSDEGQFMFYQIVKKDNPSLDHYFSGKFTQFCFSAFKVLPVFGDRVEFLWDVKILYELLGYKFNDLIDLGKQILGPGRMEKYVDLSDRTKAHINSYKVANININAYEAIQILPEELVGDLYIERAKIIMVLLARLSFDDRKFYKSFYSSVKMLFDISKEPLNIDLGAISSDFSHYADMIRRNTKDGKAYLKFKAVGAKTGRVGFEKGSFNLYTLPKDLRSCIVASEDSHFVEFDFKASQPRIAIFSTGDNGFMDVVRSVEDIYSIFPGDREKVKLGFIAWMFGKTRVPGSIYEKYAWPIWELRNNLAKQSAEKGFLDTRFGRRLYNHDEEKHVVFQNWITATEVDFILKLTEKLVEAGVNVKFPYHDAIICEMKDLNLIPKYKEICEDFFEEIFNARGPVGVKVGKNFGSMNEV